MPRGHSSSSYVLLTRNVVLPALSSPRMRTKKSSFWVRERYSPDSRVYMLCGRAAVSARKDLRRT